MSQGGHELDGRTIFVDYASGTERTRQFSIYFVPNAGNSASSKPEKQIYKAVVADLNSPPIQNGFGVIMVDGGMLHDTKQFIKNLRRIDRVDVSPVILIYGVTGVSPPIFEEINSPFRKWNYTQAMFKCIDFLTYVKNNDIPARMKNKKKKL